MRYLELLLDSVPRQRSRRRFMALIRQAFVTTPTSYFARLTGTETWTDPVNFGTAAHLFGGVVIPGTQPPVAIAAATTTLTLTPAAHGNRLITIASTGGLAVTPPAATGTGNVYTFFCTATLTGGSFTFDAKAGQASDLMNGISWHVLTGGTTVASAPTAANSNLFTWNGTTTGGVLGSFVSFIDAALHNWLVQEEGINSSTSATPFSNH